MSCVLQNVNRDGQFLGEFKQRERRFCVKKKAIYLRTFQLSNKKQNNSCTATEAKSTNLVKQEPNKDKKLKQTKGFKRAKII